ncbi:restriction endonuclease subunit S [Vibrio metoecus]|uniref:restriction endonuclease subunit S n=1 Tax=Vibrio metoecus TaxID=1481663 RepID=UPI0006D84A25|nr:restriction endonuclease subunit S [Vibrio metoecus]KQA22154.1 restriction endonuclease subunit S [Vibrio metoecus]
MSVENNVPEIRFKGFSGEWVEKPLNHEVELFSGLTYSPKDIRKEGVFVIRSSNVKNGQIVQADNVYVNPEVINCSNVQKGDIIVVVRNGSRSLIGKHAQVHSLMNDTVIGAFMTGVRASYPEFINALFDTDKFKAQVEKNLGATINQITNGAFNSMVFMFPEGQEKTAIGNTFQKLDNLINQHQQKHDKLSNIKKAMLEKMFPKQGETTPEIRFKGFSGEWVESSIGEICGATFGGGTPSTNDKDFWQGEIPWIQSSDLKDGVVSAVTAKKYITKSAVNKSATKLIAGNSIAIVTRVGVGKLSLMQGEYATSQDFLSLSDLKIDSQYAVYVIWKQLQIEKEQVQGTSIKGITKGELLGKFISHPETTEEQTAIGSYFQKLDALINQHQQQITKLTNIKQACLSKMFV